MPPPRRNGYAGRVPIPDVLATVLLERVRRLNRTDRAVLMRASVIGPRFKFAVLSAVLRLPEERVRAALDEACALEFIIRETERGDWYAFRHALLRDIIREEFIGTRLRPLHRHITQALERCVEAREDRLRGRRRRKQRQRGADGA